MGMGENINPIGRTLEIQAIYQQSLLTSDLETRQTERRLASQRREKEQAVQPGPDVLPDQPTDLELSHRNSDTNPRYGSGRHLDIQA